MNNTTPEPDLLDEPDANILGTVSSYGPNLMQVNTTLTLAELHEFLNYEVSSEIAPKADGPIAEILRTVQRPSSKDRQQRMGVYIENNILKPKPLDESPDQGFVPAITLLADKPLRLIEIPNIPSKLGQKVMLVGKKYEGTKVIPSDGVTRITGFENRSAIYSKANADLQTRQLRTDFAKLRIPTLILFPKIGTLRTEHMQQALYDMNVLATQLTSTMALNRDNRSPYGRVGKAILADQTANLKQYLPLRDPRLIIRFVKVAIEGAKVAEKAGATGGSLPADIVAQATTDLTYFWSILASSMAPGTLQDKENMATGAPGITGLALVAHELFYGRRKNLDLDEKAAAIRKLGAIDWSRSKPDADGSLILNPIWVESGLLIAKANRRGKMRAVMGGAGANNSRIMTSLLFKVTGLEKTTANEPDEAKLTSQLVSA